MIMDTNDLNSFWDEEYGDNKNKKGSKKKKTSTKKAVSNSFDDDNYYDKKKSSSIAKIVAIIVGIVAIIGIAVGASLAVKHMNEQNVESETVAETTVAAKEPTVVGDTAYYELESGEYVCGTDFESGTYNIEVQDGGGKYGLCQVIVRKSNGMLKESFEIGDATGTNEKEYSFENGESIKVSYSVKMVQK